MRNFIYALLITATVIIFGSSCSEKCYECTRKCGTCTKGAIQLFGCEGDSALSGFSVDSWRVYLEGQGYTCEYNDIVETNVCEDSDKKAFEDSNYSCKEE